MKRMLKRTNHWVNERLVAISEVCGEPPWGFIEGFGGPLAIGQIDRLEKPIFGRGIFEPRTG